MVTVHCGEGSCSISDLTEKGCEQELETIMDDDEDMADLYLTVSTFCRESCKEKLLALEPTVDPLCRFMQLPVCCTCTMCRLDNVCMQRRAEADMNRQQSLELKRQSLAEQGLSG